MGDLITSIKQHMHGCMPLVHEDDVEEFLQAITHTSQESQQEMYELMCDHKGFAEVIVGNFVAKRRAFLSGDTGVLGTIFEEERNFLQTV